MPCESEEGIREFSQASSEGTILCTEQTRGDTPRFTHALRFDACLGSWLWRAGLPIHHWMDGVMVWETISLVQRRRLVIKAVVRSDTRLREEEWNSPEGRKSFWGKLNVATVRCHGTVILLRRWGEPWASQWEELQSEAISSGPCLLLGCGGRAGMKPTTAPFARCNPLGYASHWWKGGKPCGVIS